MSEFIGVIVIALALTLLNILTPWLRKNQDTWYMHAFLGDLVTIGFMIIFGLGVAMVVVQLAELRAAGDTTNLAISIAALVIGVPLLTYGIRRVLGLGRAAA